MQDSSKKALGWTVGTVFLGFIAAYSSNPWIKFIFASGAVGTGTQAVRYFRAAVRESYQQLIIPKSTVPTV